MKSSLAMRYMDAAVSKSLIRKALSASSLIWLSIRSNLQQMAAAPVSYKLHKSTAFGVHDSQPTTAVYNTSSVSGVLKLNEDERPKSKNLEPTPNKL